MYVKTIREQAMENVDAAYLPLGPAMWPGPDAYWTLVEKERVRLEAEQKGEQS